jgi:hypothetical protein
MDNEKNAGNGHDKNAIDSQDQITKDKAVEIHKGSAHTVQAEKVNISQGGVQLVEGESVNMSSSGALSIRAQTIKMEQSGAGIISGEEVELKDNSTGGVIIAGRVNGPSIHTSVLLASEVYGNVQTALDPRSALLFGLGAGIGLGLLLSIKTIFKE